MGNESENSTSIKLLEHKLSSLESNMAKQSDVAVLAERINDISTLASDIRGLTKELHALVSEYKADKQNAVHKEKRDAKQDQDIDALKNDVSEIRQYIAADKPFRDLRSLMIKSVVGFLMLGILAAAFTVSR